ncbi:MAG: glycerol kinase GlpK [Chloroflexota bacterium]|nr:glycerol kinase GlpK [Chloroflexota bacterium]MDP6757485.1 glycerol kinase GlpK [Chloroflexota bacterium]
MPHTDCILAIDQGTTGTTCLTVARDGAILSRGYATVASSFPHDGWVEQDPEAIWQSVLAAAVAALSGTGVVPVALGITNQRETTILWDSASGRALAPAIVWQCRRTAERCAELTAAGHTDLIRERTGLVIDPYFSGTKIAWLLDSDPTLRAAAEAGQARFGTVDSWLLWKLTNGAEHRIDATNASRTMLANLDGPAWDDDLLKILNVPAALLPEIVPTTGKFGVTAGAAPIPDGLTIGGIAGDQHAALFGQACFDPGMVKSTYGTGCFLLANTGLTPRPSENGLLTTVAWQIGSATTYALEGSVFIGGAVIQWLRDQLGLIQTAAESETLAASVPDTAGVVFVPAFVGLGAPHWDPAARGLIHGLTQEAGPAHIVRAGLESIAHQVADVAEIMALESGVAPSEIRVDGGAAQNDLLMQMQADFIGCRVARPANVETTAMGSALLTGLEIGFWNDLEEIRSIWTPDRQFHPADDPTVPARRRQWSRALDRAKDWT